MRREVRSQKSEVRRFPWLLGFGILLGFLSFSFAQEPTLSELWRLDGLGKPESAVYDAAQDVIYVSNIVGDVDAKDGDGYISTVSPEGEMLNSEWLMGLDAPKGLAVFEDKLYIADLDMLIEASTETGEVLARYEARPDAFLNDVTADTAGNIYVSDSQQSVLYRLMDGALEPFLEDAEMLSPNGLYATENALIIAASDSSAAQPYTARYLRALDYETLELSPLSDGTSMGSLDGVEPDGRGGYFLSDWGTGLMLHYSAEGELVILELLEQGAADFAYVPEQNRLYLPMMFSDELIAFEVSW